MDESIILVSVPEKLAQLSLHGHDVEVAQFADYFSTSFLYRR